VRTTYGLLSLAIVCAFGCGKASEPPPFKPVADVKQLMQGIIDPSADVLWERSGEIIAPEGTTSRAPKSEEQWAEVRAAAITLTESGNLLMMVPRAKDGDEWMKRSQELIDVGTAAWKAAEAKNVDQLFNVGADVYDTCSRCHQKYMEAIVNANK
jgi:predicted secreted protein